jgi:hypothetical protein
LRQVGGSGVEPEDEVGDGAGARSFLDDAVAPAAMVSNLALLARSP